MSSLRRCIEQNVRATPFRKRLALFAVFFFLQVHGAHRRTLTRNRGISGTDKSYQLDGGKIFKMNAERPQREQCRDTFVEIS